MRRRSFSAIAQGQSASREHTVSNKTSAEQVPRRRVRMREHSSTRIAVARLALIANRSPSRAQQSLLCAHRKSGTHRIGWNIKDKRYVHPHSYSTSRRLAFTVAVRCWRDGQQRVRKKEKERQDAPRNMTRAR